MNKIYTRINNETNKKINDLEPYMNIKIKNIGGEEERDRDIENEKQKILKLGGRANNKI